MPGLFQGIQDFVRCMHTPIGMSNIKFICFELLAQLGRCIINVVLKVVSFSGMCSDSNIIIKTQPYTPHIQVFQVTSFSFIKKSSSALFCV
jgi:hypothetical protein